MTGLEYHRKKCRLSKKKLSQRSGVSECTITRYESGEEKPGEAQVSKLLYLADVLHVTIDELVQTYDDGLLEDGDHFTYDCATLQNDNPIANYRRAENLTMQQLADRLDCKRQNIWKACKEGGRRKKLVQKLCAYHKIDEATFFAIYGKADCA